MYGKNTVYVVGNSRTNTDNAITQKFVTFFIGFVAERDSGEIVDVSCSSTIRTTDEFIVCLFIGKSLKYYDEALENEIKNRYFGSSQKAIIVAYKDAVKKFNEIPKWLQLNLNHIHRYLCMPMNIIRKRLHALCGIL